MAERIVSAGVFTRENDQSFVQQGIAEIGAAFIGPTTKGPAFVPTKVSSYADYQIKFGASNGNSYLPVALREYLKNSGTATIVRTLGLGGYSHASAIALTLSGSYGIKTVGLLHHTSKSPSAAFTSGALVGAATQSQNFSLIVSGTNIVGTVGQTYTGLSMLSTSTGSIGKILGSNPINSTADAFNYTLFKNYADLHVSSSGTAGVVVVNLISLPLATDYSQAYTPIITSQLVSGVAQNLFQFKSISHGTSTNREVKVAITNIKLASEVVGSDYGTFSVVVRDVNDNDRQQIVLEQFNNLTLDPDSTNYIGKKIGTKSTSFVVDKLITSGDYANMSKYIYVDIQANVEKKSLSPSLVPAGFRAISQPFSGSYVMPTASMVVTQSYNSQYNDKIHFGFNFDFDTTDNLNYLTPIASNAISGNNADFNLSSAVYFNGGVTFENADVANRKFIVPMQGGFDGVDPAIESKMGTDITVATNVMGYDLSANTASGSVAFNRAITLLSDVDNYDVNAVFMPGITYDLAPAVITNAIDMVETRGDAFLVFDPVIPTTTTITTVIDAVSSVNSSYAATYWPWIKKLDVDKNKYVWCPPSVAAIEAISYNDKVGYEWFAPAGLNRGLTNASDVYVNLKQADRDSLYEERINPIASFPNVGITIWGQKTMQNRASALDRVNVRRLLINVKKFIASTSKYLVFEGATQQLYTQFLNSVNPYLEMIQQKAGLYEFKVVMDETNNTGDTLDRNELHGALYLKPTKTAEFIIIDLNVTSTGASFGA